MNLIKVFLAFFLINQLCHASLIANEKSPSVSYKQKNYKLVKKGKGTRIKKIAFVSIAVYEAQLYHSDTLQLSATEPQLDQQDLQLGIELTFLRSVDSEKIMNAYLDSLKANKVKTDNPAIQHFLNTVKATGELAEKNKITIIGIHLENGDDVILYEDQKGRITEISGKDLVKDIFSIWLGQTTDDQLEQLKKDLLK